MSDWIRSLSGWNWNDPRIIVLVTMIAIVSLLRRWSLILLLVLVLVLGQGLEYLLSYTSLNPEFTHGLVIGVYVFGGLILLFLAIAHFLTKE